MIACSQVTQFQRRIGGEWFASHVFVLLRLLRLRLASQVSLCHDNTTQNQQQAYSQGGCESLVHQCQRKQSGTEGVEVQKRCTAYRSQMKNNQVPDQVAYNGGEHGQVSHVQ